LTVSPDIAKGRNNRNDRIARSAAYRSGHPRILPLTRQRRIDRRPGDLSPAPSAHPLLGRLNCAIDA